MREVTEFGETPGPVGSRARGPGAPEKALVGAPTDGEVPTWMANKVPDCPQRASAGVWAGKVGEL